MKKSEVFGLIKELKEKKFLGIIDSDKQKLRTKGYIYFFMEKDMVKKSDIEKSKKLKIFLAEENKLFLTSEDLEMLNENQSEEELLEQFRLIRDSFLNIRN